MAATQVLRMTFKNASGQAVSISLNDPRADLTEAEVVAAMDLVIAKNIFASAGGDLVSKQEARLIETNTVDIYPPA